MGRYDLNDPRDYMALCRYIEDAYHGKRLVECKVVRPRRTTPQRKYMEFCFRWFAHETGYTVQDVKQVIFKRQACPHIFAVTRTGKNGRAVTTYRSTADLTVDECTGAIDNFIEWAWRTADVRIPRPDDMINIRYCEREIERTERYGT